MRTDTLFPRNTPPADEFQKKHKHICHRLREGQSIRNTAKITGKGISTVQRVKAAIPDR